MRIHANLAALALALGALLAPLAAAGDRAGPGLEDFQLDALRVTRDPDGHSNLRSGPGTDHKVTGRIASGAVISIAGEKNSWAERDLTGEEKGEPGGHIHSSRLTRLNDWRVTPGKPSADDRAASVSAGTFHAGVSSASFEAKDHKVARKEDQVDTIDGKIPWGVDGNMPTRALRLTATIDGKAVAIPAKATEDLFQPNMESLLLLRPAGSGDPLVLVMSNSDGAGFYTVAWSFSGGVYTGRAILPAP